MIVEEDCKHREQPRHARHRPGRRDDRLARRAHPRPHPGRGRGRRQDRRRDRQGRRADRRGGRGPDRRDRHPVGQHPLASGLRERAWRLRQMLRARSRPRHAGQYRRGGRRDRRPVDRRAGHAADDADLPHRRRRPAQRDVEPRSDGRRHGRVPRPADDHGRARPPRRDVAHRRGRDRRHGRPRALHPPHPLWRAPDVSTRPYRHARATGSPNGIRS